MARIFEISERKVQMLARDGVIPKAKHGHYELIPCVQGYLRHLRGVAAGHKSEDGVDLVAQRARLASEQADGYALKNAHLRGELVPVSEVEAAWTSLNSAVQRALLTLASTVAPLVAAENESRVCEGIVREHIQRALSELSDAKIITTPTKDSRKPPID